MEIFLYILLGIAIGLILGYLLVKLNIQRNYNHKNEFTELEKLVSSLQIENATRLSKQEVADNFVTRELYDSINSNLSTSNNNLEKERTANEGHQATILRLTSESEQKLTKIEVELYM